MKKLLLTIIILSLLQNIYCNSDPFYVSDEDVNIKIFSESEYNSSLYYNSAVTYSEGLEVYSKTPNIKIFINGKQYNVDSLKLYTMELGYYFIKIMKEDYTTVSRWVNLESGKRIIINLTLAREFGFLNVNTNRDENIVFLNDKIINKNMKIPSGKYKLRVKSFGFEEQSKEIYINPNITLNEYFELLPAPFKFENIVIDKKEFNPNSKEGFGLNRIKISVNGPSKGVLNIKNSFGEIIFFKDITFNNWSNYYTYNGDDQNGNNLKYGDYIIEVKAENELISTKLIVNKDLKYHNLPNYNGFSGLLLSPTAEYNPSSIKESNFNINYDFKRELLSFPFSFKTPIIDHLDIQTGFTLFTLTKQNIMGFNMFFGFFYYYDFDFLTVGLNTNYQYDYSGNNISNSLKINAPTTFNFNQFHLSFAPEYTISFESTNLLSLGLGIHYDNEKSRTGISSKINYINNEFKILYGFEWSYLLKNSQNYLGVGLITNNSFDTSLNFNLSMLF